MAMACVIGILLGVIFFSGLIWTLCRVFDDEPVFHWKNPEKFALIVPRAMIKRNSSTWTLPFLFLNCGYTLEKYTKKNGNQQIPN